MVGPAMGSRAESQQVDQFGCRQFGRRQVWASPGRGVAMIGVDRLMCRCCHPPIPTGRKDRGGDDTLRGNGTGEEASGPGTSEQ